MLIAITGRKGSGKDTIGGFLRLHNMLEVKFAGTLKNMLRTLYRDADLDEQTIERKIEGDLKEEPCEILGGATPRWAMQSLGTEWAKMVDPTHQLWSRIWSNKAAAILKDGVPVVVTDLRFLHEACAVEDLGGTIWRVTRPGTESDDAHISELEMEKIIANTVIVNAGTIDDLEDKTLEALRKATR